MRIFLIGFMGSGKTHWGRILSSKTGMAFFDLDQVITDDEKLTVQQIFATKGEEYFRFKEREVLEALVEDHQDLIVSCGGGTPCFFMNIDYMKLKGKVIWLSTPVNILVERLIKEKNHRPLIRNINDNELETFIRKKLQERKLYYEQADVRLEENDVTTEAFIEIVKNA